MTTWKELFPEGRVIFYEGRDPKGFRREIKQHFGFDVAKDGHWNKAHGYSFLCPAEYLDDIYENIGYRMGS